MNLDQRARVNRTIDQAPPDYADVWSWKEAWYLQRAIIGWLQLRHWYDRSEVHGLRRIKTVVERLLFEAARDRDRLLSERGAK